MAQGTAYQLQHSDNRVYWPEVPASGEDSQYLSFDPVDCLSALKLVVPKVNPQDPYKSIFLKARVIIGR